MARGVGIRDSRQAVLRARSDWIADRIQDAARDHHHVARLGIQWLCGHDGKGRATRVRSGSGHHVLGGGHELPRHTGHWLSRSDPGGGHRQGHLEEAHGGPRRNRGGVDTVIEGEADGPAGRPTVQGVQPIDQGLLSSAAVRKVESDVDRVLEQHIVRQGNLPLRRGVDDPHRIKGNIDAIGAGCDEQRGEGCGGQSSAHRDSLAMGTVDVFGKTNPCRLQNH